MNLMKKNYFSQDEIGIKKKVKFSSSFILALSKSKTRLK